MMLQRRSFLIGLGSLVAAPMIVHADNLMPIKPIMVRGIRWQSWSQNRGFFLGFPRGIITDTCSLVMDHAGWHIGAVTGQKKVPLSYFSEDIKKYSALYPDFNWQIID